jgi:hypothetical protein
MESPAYFSFDQKESSIRELKDKTFEAEVKIGSPWNTCLTIHGIQSSEPFTTPQQITKPSLPLLKSNLQKCVRRKDFERAARTALAIFSFNPNELLRRLPVIMIEDCLPYPSGHSRLIWWMCAVSKGYKMSHAEVEQMLGILSTMCESNEYEVCQQEDHEKIDWTALSAAQQTFLWSLEIRRLYGGMKVDGRMYAFHQRLWSERFATTTGDWWNKLQNQDAYLVDISTIGPITNNDILLESIDHHVHSWIPRKIAERIEGTSAEKIKLAIWDCRSRTNHRTPATKGVFRPTSSDTNRLFARINKELNGLCKWLLSKTRFENGDE